jgi:hypothetical protein
MRCHDVQEAVIAARYDGLEASAEVRAHVASCASCSAFAAESAAVEGLLASDSDEPARPGFDTRFFARLADEKAKRQTKVWRWPRLAFVSFGTALAALLVVVVVSRSEPREDAAGATDLELAMNLEMIEELDVVAKLDEVEAFEAMAQADAAELDAALRDAKAVQ